MSNTSLSLHARLRIKEEYGLDILPPADLKSLVDGVGRTLPVAEVRGGSVNWLTPENEELRKHLGGQVGRVNNYFARKVASIPWTLWRKGKDGKPEQIHDSPLLDLLWRPNPETGQVEYMRQQATVFKGAGDVFIWANKLDDGPRKGQAKELWITTRRHMQVEGGGNMDAVTGYVFTPDLSKPGQTQRLQPEEVLHLKNDPLPGDKYGSSTIVAASREATADQASITAQVSQMQNQGAPGVLWYDFVNGAPVETSADQRRQMRDQINSYAAPGRRGEFPVSGSKMGWTSIGTSAVDLDILAFRQANFRDICGYWGVPSELLGDKEKSTYNNVAEARKAFYTDAALPYVENIVAEYSWWLCPMFEPGTWLQVDTSGIPELQQDKATLAGWLKDAWYIPVERRVEMLGETPDPGFKGYWVPAGLIHVKSTTDLQSSLNEEGSKRLRDFEEYPGASTDG